MMVVQWKMLYQMTMVLLITNVTHKEVLFVNLEVILRIIL